MMVKKTNRCTSEPDYNDPGTGIVSTFLRKRAFNGYHVIVLVNLQRANTPTLTHVNYSDFFIGAKGG